MTWNTKEYAALVEKMPKSKKVRLKLVGLDGNIFALMDAFKERARKDGWTTEEVKVVLDECRAGDYYHLLVTLMEVLRNGGA